MPSPATPVMFARGSIPAQPKTGGVGAVVDAVSAAVTGQPLNGTVNGKRGFQLGNKYGANRHPGGVREAGKRHTAAMNTAAKALKAHKIKRTAGSLREAQQATRTAAAASRELDAARLAATAARNQARREARAAGKSDVAPKPANSPTPTIEPRMARQARFNSEAAVARAHGDLDRLKTFVAAGHRDNDQLLDEVDRIGGATRKADLIKVAKRLGIPHGAGTKAQVLDRIKGHVYEHGLAAQKVRGATPPAAPRYTPGPARPTGVRPTTPAPTPAPTPKVAPAPAPAPTRVAVEAEQAAKARSTLETARQQHQAPGIEPRPTSAPPAPEAERKAAALGALLGAVKSPSPVQQQAAERRYPTTADHADKLRDAVASAGVKNHDLLGLERIAAEHVARHATKAPSEIRPTGRRESESAFTINHAGTNFHFTATQAGYDKATSAFAHLAGAGEHIPLHISRHTKDVFLTTHEAQAENHINRPEGFAAAKVAGVANGHSVSVFGPGHDNYGHGVLAHEMSHNFARHLYGSTTPTPTSDFERARQSGEGPVNRYGATSSKEDFATSFQQYFEGKNRFRRSHPERFAVVDRLVKDPTYGG